VRARHRLATLAVLAVVVLAVALLVSSDRGFAVQVWLASVVAVVTLVVADRWSRTLPLAPPLERLTPTPVRTEPHVDQLDALRRQLLQARTSSIDLHRFFRPNVIELASVRLARRHGIDLAAQPDRAHRLVGSEVWELVRPDRERPATLSGRGWPTRRLQQLVHELEDI